MRIATGRVVYLREIKREAVLKDSPEKRAGAYLALPAEAISYIRVRVRQANKWETSLFPRYKPHPKLTLKQLAADEVVEELVKRVTWEEQTQILADPASLIQEPARTT